MTVHKNKNSRRDLLKGVALVFPAVALSRSESHASENDSVNELASDTASTGELPAIKYVPTYFTPSEWRFIEAASDCLIPKDEHGPGALELGVPEYIDRQMNTAWAEGAQWYLQGPFMSAKPEFGYQSLLPPRQQYRIAIKEINTLCVRIFKNEFAQLSAEQQRSVIHEIETGTLTSPGISLSSFFDEFLLVNVREGYFCDPKYGGNRKMGSWSMLGYPGARADYLEWIGNPHRYPYGPVSINGKSE